MVGGATPNTSSLVPAYGLSGSRNARETRGIAASSSTRQTILHCIGHNRIGAQRRRLVLDDFASRNARSSLEIMDMMGFYSLLR
jgi:hypothetical protein